MIQNANELDHLLKSYTPWKNHLIDKYSGLLSVKLPPFSPIFKSGPSSTILSIAAVPKASL